MGFLFFRMMPMGLRLAALRAARAPLIFRAYYIYAKKVSDEICKKRDVSYIEKFTVSRIQSSSVGVSLNEGPLKALRSHL